MKYTDEHIDALIARLNEYEAIMDGEMKELQYCKCLGMYWQCESCLIKYCGGAKNGMPARDSIHYNKLNKKYNRVHVIIWYNTMFDRANKNLKAARSQYSIVGHYPKHKQEKFITGRN